MRKWFGTLLFVLVFVSATVSYGFPLQTTDGRVKIYGMMPTDDGFALDVYSPSEAGIRGVSIAPDLKVQIVDADDRFIDSYNKRTLSHPDYNDRALYYFKFDKPVTQISRLRIETPDSDVYSVSWSGVPEASNKNVTIRLYGIKDNSGSISYESARYKQYDFEVRITNNRPIGLVLSPKYFWLVDQFNYGYAVNAEEYKLLPNESVRYTLNSQKMSPLSRPNGLYFIPENFTIDLEGWY